MLVSTNDAEQRQRPHSLGEFTASTLSWLAIVVGLAATASNAANVSDCETFESLTRNDQPEKWQADAQTFEVFLDRARAGQIKAQGVVAGAMDRSDQRRRAFCLYQQMLNLHSFDSVKEDERDFLFNAADSAAIAYVVGEITPTDPERGITLFINSILNGDPYSAKKLSFVLRTAEYLPPSNSLATLWERYAQSKEPFTLTDLESEVQVGVNIETPPADSNFSTCEGLPGKTAEIYGLFQSAQEAILENPQQASHLQEKAYERIASITSSEGASRVTFNLDEMHAAGLLRLMAELFGRKLHGETTVGRIPLIVRTKNTPIGLIFSRVVEESGLSLRCDDDWILVQSSATGEAASAHMHLLIGGFVTGYDPPASAGGRSRGTIAWTDGHTYVGDLNHGRADGNGEYKFANGDTLVGTFADGVPHGKARQLRPDGRLVYDGDHVHGERHGRGELLEVPRSGAETPMIYRGPMQHNARHGRGECTYADIRYSCTFHNGLLIGVGETSLFPN